MEGKVRRRGEGRRCHGPDQVWEEIVDVNAWDHSTPFLWLEPSQVAVVAVYCILLSVLAK